MAKNRRIHVMATTRQYDKMVKLAEETGYSISELMRRAIDLYLSKTARKKDGEV